MSELAGLQALTKRERHVLRLVADGLSTKTIAAELRISNNTTRYHVSCIYSKLNVKARNERASASARRSGSG